MKTTALGLAVLTTAAIVNAQNVPTTGLTGLWRFQNSAAPLTATIGNNMTTSDPGNSAPFIGPWTVINPGLSDNGIVQETAWNYLTVNPNFHANGGGDYVNKYTVMIDYIQTSGVGSSWNSLFQTAADGHANDGDLWIAPDGTMGSGDIGYSSSGINAGTWHRIAWSVDNGNFFRIYVDGSLLLDGAGQSVDGRYSLYPDVFNLFADNDWEDQWGLVGTVATWDHALTTDEIAGMGGWLNGSPDPTALTIPEPSTLALVALGGLVIARRSRK
ncbi:MAG: LamG-like jellyroll fold domain-containing protein [Verrucomicrobiota bacterium]